jgi:penicillin amidase
VVAALALAVSMIPAAHADSSAGEATIVRDGYGVPHVYADTARELFYAMGHVAADDRLWQAEILRRSATGTLAELFGPDVVAQDVQARTLFGPVERRQALFDSAPSETQEMLSAYVEGLNARIAEESASGTLPDQFAAVGPPRTWTVDDSIATFMLLGSQFGWFGSEELDNLTLWTELQARFGADAATVFGDLFWLDDPDARTTNPGGRGRSHRGGPPDRHYGADDVEAARQFAEDDAAAEEAREEMGLVDGPASNAIVISGKLSRSGRPLLLGGPQMGYSTPQINHEIGLHGAGYDVTGMSIAGFPLVPIGVGDGYAWTLTSGGSDNTDIFAEQLDPADPTRYLFDGEWRSMDCRSEDIAVAGGLPVAQVVCSTVHGPVIGVSGSTAFSLHNVTVGHELESLAAWGSLGSSDSIDDFVSRLDEVAYNFNVLYADNDGNIGYWHIGFMPIRAEGVNPFFPAPGTGEAEWQGIRPFSENPQRVNPRQGWMASWNNKPEKGWENSTSGFWMWGPTHRVNTLFEQLGRIRKGSATISTLEQLNVVGSATTDTPTGSADTVFVSTDLESMVSEVDRSADPRLRSVLREMRRWDRLQTDADGDGFYDTPWGAVFNAWWAELASSSFDEVYELIDRNIAGNLVHRLLRGDRAALALQHDWLGDVTLKEAVTGALIAALDQLAAAYGSDDPADWRQPIATIDWEPLPLTPGVGSTIWMNRGTYNQLVSLSDRLRADNVIAPGQSGEASSPHFSDQLELYATWTYKRMHLTERDVRRHAVSEVTLAVP